MHKIEKLKLNSKKQFELIDITDKVKKILESSGIKNGMVTIYAPHTTASIKLNHNENLLKQDLMNLIYRLVPIDFNYSHDIFEIRSGVDANERSNGHAHIKSFLLGASETIPVENGTMMLGGKQSIFFVE